VDLFTRIETKEEKSLKTDRILGFVFILAGGIIYSMERAVSILSTSMIRAGFFAGSMSGEVPAVEASGLFSNPFAPIFLCLGIGLILYSFIKNK